MDRMDLCLIPFIYLFRITLILLSKSTFTVHTPSIIGRELKNTVTWMTVSGMHSILFALSGIHILIKFKVAQVPLNTMLQIPLPQTIMFRTKFYYRLFK